MKQLKGRDGMTIVTVIAAFGILMIGLAMFTTALYAAVKSIQEAQDIRKDGQAAMEEYYTGGGMRDPIYDGTTPGAENKPVAYRLIPRNAGESSVVLGESMKYTSDEGFVLYYFIPQYTGG